MSYLIVSLDNKLILDIIFTKILNQILDLDNRISQLFMFIKLLVILKKLK